MGRTQRLAWMQLMGALLALGLLAIGLPGPVTALSVLVGDRAPSTPGPGAVAASQTALLLVAAIAVWVLLLWGSVVALAAVAGRLPGTAGRLGRRFLFHVSPIAARKLVLTVLGASMVTGLAACGTDLAPGASVERNVQHVAGADHRSLLDPAAGAAVGVVGQAGSWTSVEGSAVQLGSALSGAAANARAAAGPVPPKPLAPKPVAPASQPLPSLDWPTTGPPAPNPPTRATSAPAVPASAAPSGVQAGSTKAGSTKAGSTKAGSTKAAAHSPNGPVDIDWPTTGSVVVLRGDSLWSIASRHLPASATPADIDRAWHEWYAANTSVIGPNPNLILPGQILLPPTAGTGTS